MTHMTPVQVLSRSIQFKGGLKAPNRTLKSAMTERLCTYDETDLGARGKPTPEYVELYKVWGEGQIGVIVLGNIPIHRENLEAKGNAIIDKDSPWDPVEAFKPAIAAAKAHGSLVIGQLTHGGRQTPIEMNPNPVSASESQCPSAFGMTFAKARELTVEEIHDLIDRWAYGAEVLYKAGADGAQLHCAHGYLLSQFLSPRVNKRADEYGGSLDNRSRIVFEIIAAIKKRVTDPKFIVSIKYNSHDFIEGGFSPEESQVMARKMEAAGVQLIELSGGTYEDLPFIEKKESTLRREGFFVEFAERIRPHLSGASVLAVTGGFRSLEGMALALSSEKRTCDMVGLGRPLVFEPKFAADLLSGKTQRAMSIAVARTLHLPVASYVLILIGNKKAVPDLQDEKTAQEIVNLVSSPKK